jgi:hypothetical protein
VLPRGFEDVGELQPEVRSADAVAWSVFATASGSRSGIFEQFRVPAGQCGLAGTICSGDESQGGASHREGGVDFLFRSARIFFKRFFSMATPFRAAWAIFCAISVKFVAMT